MNLFYSSNVCYLPFTSFIIFLIMCMVTDLKFRKIPNKVTFPYLFITVLIQFLQKTNYISFLRELLTFLIPLYVLYKLKILGGGDFKTFLISSLILDKRIFISSLIITLLLSSLYLETNNLVYKRQDDNGRVSPPLVTIFGTIVIVFITLDALISSYHI